MKKGQNLHCVFRRGVFICYLSLKGIKGQCQVNLEQRISPRIFEKLRNVPSEILRGLGETDS